MEEDLASISKRAQAREAVSQLADDILRMGLGVPEGTADQIAKALRFLGWRKLGRVIATREELDALAVGSVVLDMDDAAHQKDLDYAEIPHWYEVGRDLPSDRGPALPARVLHEGGEE